MFDLKEGWNISFAGCGFLGVYHIGVASCLLEQAPVLVRGASKIYGASAGALTASVLASEASLARCCEDVLELAREARKRNLGPIHPSFNVVKIIRGGLKRDLPDDGHILASRQLCVSLTRVSDGENVLVSDFSSKEELIQALICSCFLPVYCGLIPPSFRGVRYVDGGITDNLPQYQLKNTITISPFSGESDICPRDNSSNFHELRITNTSIQMNLGNLYRLTRALFPPEPKILAEMCQNGYKDAFRFLKKNNLLNLGCPSPGPYLTELKQPTIAYCCSGLRNGQSLHGKPIATDNTKERLLRKLRLLRKQSWWLEERIVDRLPPPLKQVFCEACRETHGLYAQMTELLPVRVVSFMLLPYTLPVELAYFVIQRLLEWIPEVSDDVRWFCGMAGALYRQMWKGTSREASWEMRASRSKVLNCLHESDRPSQLSSLDLSSHY